MNTVKVRSFRQKHDCRVASVKQLTLSLQTLDATSARSMADVTLSPLPRADGSATFTSNGYSVIAAVNGPIEVQRRDELPEEAAIDVAIRPAAGVGGKDRCCSNYTSSSMLLTYVTGVRERHLESILQSTLRHVILVSAHPRTLIQLTLQIVSSKEGSFNAGDLPQATSVRLMLQLGESY